LRWFRGAGGLTGEFNTGDAEFDALGNTAIAVFNDGDAFVGEGTTAFSAVVGDGGSSVYNGVAILSAGTYDGDTGEETVNYLAAGSFTATADFGDARSLTGTADGFFEIANPEIANSDPLVITDAVNGGSIPGSFTFDLGIGDSVGFAVTAGTVNGSVTANDDTVVGLSDAYIQGEFFGNDLDMVELIGGAYDSGDATFVGITANGLR